MDATPTWHDHRSNESNRMHGLPGLDSHEYELLAAVSRRIKLADGELLFEAGEHSHNIYFVSKGRVAVGKSCKETACMDQGPYGFVDLVDCDQDCENCWVHKLTQGPGGCVGETATLDNKPHAFSAKGIGRVELLEVDVLRIKPLLESHPNIRRCLRRNLLEA